MNNTIRNKAWRKSNLSGPALWILCTTLCAGLIVFACTETDDSNPKPDDGGDTDSCGYALVEVPEGCDTCHGAPPETARHPDNHRCFRCHGYVIDENWEWVDAGRHNDGNVDYAVGCTSCHGWDLGSSPPQSLDGECTEGTYGIGAHKAMRRDALMAHKVACSNCHTVPLTTWSQGHIDGDGVAEVAFKNLATVHGAQPVWNGKTCSGTYCHGATLTGGNLKEPSWFDTSGEPGRCGACHRITDPTGDPDADCSSCHPTSIDADRFLLPQGTHINGYIDMPGDAK